MAMLIGLGMGTIAGLWFRRGGDFILLNLLVGLVGAILGLALDFFTRAGQTWGLFSTSGLLASVCGAAICLVLYQLIIRLPKREHKTIEHQE